MGVPPYLLLGPWGCEQQKGSSAAARQRSSLLRLFLGNMYTDLNFPSNERQPVPNLRVETTHLTPNQPLHRFKVKATGETGAAVSENGYGHVIGRSVSIGPRQNVLVIDLCDDQTGEIRTFRADFLERIQDDAN